MPTPGRRRLSDLDVDRTVGLPSATGDIGHWLEPLGPASLVVQGFVVAIGLGGLLTSRRAD